MLHYKDYHWSIVNEVYLSVSFFTNTGVNVVSVTAVTDISRWRAMFLVSFTIVDSEIITQYSLVFRVIFNVLSDFKLKLYRFSHSLIALKLRNRQEKKNTVIWVTANSSYGYQQQFIFCSYLYHHVFFSCRLRIPHLPQWQRKYFSKKFGIKNCCQKIYLNQTFNYDIGGKFETKMLIFYLSNVPWMNTFNQNTVLKIINDLLCDQVHGCK